MGSAPTLAWDAPQVGAATSYSVTIHAVESSPMGVNIQKLATLYTRTTSLRLPESLLTSGGAFVATITAISAPGADLAARPFIAGPPYARQTTSPPSSLREPRTSKGQTMRFSRFKARGSRGLTAPRGSGRTCDALEM